MTAGRRRTQHTAGSRQQAEKATLLGCLLPAAGCLLLCGGCQTVQRWLSPLDPATPAVRRMFDIANYWLDDTRTEMAEFREKKEGQRSVVVPAVFHFEKKKPFVDEEGRALQALEHVQLNDVTGPMADKALFLAGGVK